MQDILDKELWYEIEDQIGNVSDLRIVPYKGTEHFHPEWEVHTKQNGVDKVDYLDAKVLIQALYYVGRIWSGNRHISQKTSVSEPTG